MYTSKNIENQTLHILGYIPARLGSERVKAKNLRLLNGHPLIAYAIATTRLAQSVTSFVVNTESAEIAAVAREHGMNSYLRDPRLAESDVKTDDIVVDFLKNNPCDAVVVVNPTAPFLKAETIDNAVRRFIEKRPSALFTVNTLKKHAFMDFLAINFDNSKKSPRTQDLKPISLVNFVICIFESSYALQSFEATGSFLYSGEIDFMEMNDMESFDIDTEFEFRLVEWAMDMKTRTPQHHPILSGQKITK